ncbi:MAG: DUF86 domain-containing protein [Deltaproteobacteria bacterium]
MPRDKATLLDIRNTGRRFIDFIRDMDEAAFLEDEKTQSAVWHQLMVPGVAVKRLSGEFRTLHQDVPWSLIAGMRDQLIHAYDAVDIEEVWRTAKKDIPDLLLRIAPLLQEIS